MADSRPLRDFDDWLVLASRDPERFEAERRRVLEALIDRAPEERRQRLRALQWRVDQVRGRSPTPLAACISLTDMMWQSFAGENGLRDALHGQPPYARKIPADTRPVVVPLLKDRHKRP